MASTDSVPLKKIISGAQTGADRAALFAAKEYKLETGGWVPCGFSTHSETQAHLYADCNLQEIKQTVPPMKGAASLIVRSKKNVDDADATVVFRTHEGPGTDATIGYCLTGKWTKDWSESYYESGKYMHKPVLIISESVDFYQGVSCIANESWLPDVLRLRDFLIKHNVATLNVAGHRQSEDEHPEWTLRVQNFLLYAFRKYF